jgi:hypothetical protein
LKRRKWAINDGCSDLEPRYRLAHQTKARSATYSHRYSNGGDAETVSRQAEVLVEKKEKERNGVVFICMEE